jgi:serine phosphatase RsbU (regulator of sigma subunit)/FixJ family two-component response regulator
MGFKSIANHSKVFILCVDDDRTVLNSLRHELFEGLQKNYKIEIADSGQDGLEILKELLEEECSVPVIISDQLMPGMKGDEFLALTHRLSPATKKILLTGQATTDSIANAINKANLYRFIGKPWQKEDLVLTVEQAIKSFFTDAQLSNYVQNIKLLNEYANTLGREVNLFNWITTFIDKIIKDIGATRCLLIIQLDIAQTYYVHGWLNGNPTTQFEELEAFQLNEFYPERIIREVLHTKIKYVHNLEEDKKADLEEYNPFYCAPLLKDQLLLGCFYIESEDEEYLFNAQLIEFLDSIINQAVISLENAILYTNLEQKVRERTQTIELQKKEIEAKNKDITDSIQYARRIQYAILPNRANLKAIFPHAFIFYLPKDIVSGDFYWFTRLDSCFYIAAVDCTGHGVPGAFMAVLGNSLLNQIILEKKVQEPNVILAALDAHILQLLQQDSNTAEHNLADGMDLALCKIDLQNEMLTFSGANRPCWIVRENQLLELKQDKQSIGGSKWYSQKTNFSLHQWKLQQKDRIYLFTDGFIDQFGGENQKKYSKSKFEKWILKNQTYPMETQAEKLIEEYQTWRKKTEQLDDILVIGLEY